MCFLYWVIFMVSFCFFLHVFCIFCCELTVITCAVDCLERSISKNNLLHVEKDIKFYPLACSCQYWLAQGQGLMVKL